MDDPIDGSAANDAGTSGDGESRREQHRVAELAIALSLATDLGTGQPMEHGLRTCWTSLALARALGLDADGQRSVYHVALLRFIGCTSDASETAELNGGDNLAFNAAMAPMALARPFAGMRHFVRHVGEDLPAARRAQHIVRALAGPGMEHRSLSSHCEVAARLAERLGLPASVCHALGHAWERWDGGGHPDGLAGNDVPIEIRITSAARDIDLWTRDVGWHAATEALGDRRGRAYDPDVVDALLADGLGWLDSIDDDPCTMVLDAEPDPVMTVDDGGLDRALGAIGQFTDLASPWTRTHSEGVSLLAGAAARAAGLPADEVVVIERSALVHDVGRVGVPSGIWNRQGALTNDQWERVRLHPYLTERVLRRCSVGRGFADLAAAHHERVDGSGYHRRVGGDHLPFGARLLAAADAYHAMREDRPHRRALAASAAAAELAAEVSSGRFSRAEVDAVLDAAGHPLARPEVARPAGLTEREVDVLRLIARGSTNRAAASALGISPKTVGHHVEHIYAKCGVSTRAGATLFAMEHGLLRT